MINTLQPIATMLPWVVRAFHEWDIFYKIEFRNNDKENTLLSSIVNVIDQSPYIISPNVKLL